MQNGKPDSDKIYIYRTNNSENKLIQLIGKAFSLIIFFLIILFIVTDFMNIIDENENELLLILTAFLGFLGTYYRPIPQIHIDSLGLFIYTCKLKNDSTKLKDIHHFSITEKSIILHGKKVVNIAFSEFEGVDLIGFATFMNENIEKNRNFYEVLLSNNSMIEGFSFLVLEDKNLHESYRQETVNGSFIFRKAFLIMMIAIMLGISLLNLLPLFIYK